MAFLSGRMNPSHSDTVHDVKFNFYGNLLATASSDTLVKIFRCDPTSSSTTSSNVVDTSSTSSAAANRSFVHLQDLIGHDRAVWALAWAFPLFGNVLASVGFDKRLIVWRQQSSSSQYKPIFQHHASAALNCVEFAPYQYRRLALAVGCADGSLLFAEQQSDAEWSVIRVAQAHDLSINALSWVDAYFLLDPDEAYPMALRPDSAATTTTTTQELALERFGTRRLLSGGADNVVKLWRCGGGGQQESSESSASNWREETQFQGHNEPIRDVAWRHRPRGSGSGDGCFASASEDRYVFIWLHDGRRAIREWINVYLPQFDDVAWSLAFHPSGRLLGVFHGQSSVSLFVEQRAGQWKPLNAAGTESRQVAAAAGSGSEAAGQKRRNRKAPA